jgi:hypothetical protein
MFIALEIKWNIVETDHLADFKKATIILGKQKLYNNKSKCFKILS